MASTILDLPQPFGPMMQVRPVPLNVRWVFSRNDLKPTSSTLRSLSKDYPRFPYVRHAPRQLARLTDTCSTSSRGRRTATKSVAGLYAVAQPPGAWIGGYERNIAQRPNAVKRRELLELLLESTWGSIETLLFTLECDSGMRTIACLRCTSARMPRPLLQPIERACQMQPSKRTNEECHGHASCVGVANGRNRISEHNDGAEGDVRAVSRPDEVRIYACGPTVYDYAHIGNFRTFVFQDILRRFLRSRGFKSIQVMNFTDVDDRIIAKAAAAGVGLFANTPTSTSRRFSPTASPWAWRVPEHMVRATDHIGDMVQLIERLTAKGLHVRERGLDLFPHLQVSRLTAS
jgi:hypothetical protein